MKKRNGFTLVELLVVIFIISILTGIGLVSFSGAQKQARDTQRRSDLGQYRNALENYAVNNDSIYPQKDSGGRLYTMCASTGETLVGYLSQCLEDIKYSADSSYVYSYLSESANSRWIIYSKLETGPYYYVCSNGKNGNNTGAPAITVCN